MALTYPVDTNARYDFWNVDAGAMEVVKRKWPREDGMELEFDGNIIPLLRIHTQDIIDPATHKLGGVTGPVVDTVAQTSTYNRAAVALTQAELDQIAEDAADETEDDQLRSWYSTFYNGNATGAQTQRAVAHLIKRLLKGV
jgi:hypothetical protein